MNHMWPVSTISVSTNVSSPITAEVLVGHLDPGLGLSAGGSARNPTPFWPQGCPSQVAEVDMQSQSQYQP